MNDLKINTSDSFNPEDDESTMYLSDDVEFLKMRLQEKILEVQTLRDELAILKQPLSDTIRTPTRGDEISLKTRINQ